MLFFSSPSGTNLCPKFDTIFRPFSFFMESKVVLFHFCVYRKCSPPGDSNESGRKNCQNCEKCTNYIYHVHRAVLQMATLTRRHPCVMHRVKFNLLSSMFMFMQSPVPLQIWFDLELTYKWKGKKRKKCDLEFHFSNWFQLLFFFISKSRQRHRIATKRLFTIIINGTWHTHSMEYIDILSHHWFDVYFYELVGAAAPAAAAPIEFLMRINDAKWDISFDINRYRMESIIISAASSGTKHVYTHTRPSSAQSKYNIIHTIDIRRHRRASINIPFDVHRSQYFCFNSAPQSAPFGLFPKRTVIKRSININVRRRASAVKTWVGTKQKYKKSIVHFSQFSWSMETSRIEAKSIVAWSRLDVCGINGEPIQVQMRELKSNTHNGAHDFWIVWPIVWHLNDSLDAIAFGIFASDGNESSGSMRQQNGTWILMSDRMTDTFSCEILSTQYNVWAGVYS